MRRLLVLTLAAFAVAVTSALAASPHARVGVRSTSLGTVLVDARGHTLYVFDSDKSGRSACTGSCAALWPPLVTTGAPVALKGVKASLVGTTKRSDGKLQVTFAHHPLYLFARDSKAGEVNGVSVAHWSAVSPSGAKVHSKIGPTETTTNPYPPVYGGGGDGYGP
jgi:predicted lipoprotein with Yx(FWY)xxD motif